MSIQNTEINAKISEKETITIPSNQFHLYESCLGFNTFMKTFVFL